MVCWSLIPGRLGQQQQQHDDSWTGDNPLLLAATAGSYVTRLASRQAYKQLGRSMVAGDLIPHLKESVDVMAGGRRPAL